MRTEENIKINESKKISLEIILNQIISFDNKASTIISILGIVFALSFTVIELIITKSYNSKIVIFVFFFLFLLSVIISLLFAILTLFPRKRKGMKNNKSLTYYDDLKRMTEREYEELFCDSKNCTISFEQINQNAKICSYKHLMLKLSFFSMIPIAIFFLLTTIFIIFYK